MPRKPINPKGVKKILGYRVDPEVHEWLSNNGKTHAVERLVRNEMLGIKPEEQKPDEPDEPNDNYLSEYD